MPWLMLKDQFHRIHDYLRISLTDGCNFRCTYCMPEEHSPCLPNALLMQPDEIVEIAEKFVELGVNKIRLTGGEPLVRKEFPEIVDRLSRLPIHLTLTSNGLLVDKYLEVFKRSGISHLNISLDALNPKVFFQLTQRDKFHKVWQNILLLLENQFVVKLNVVAISGVVEDELSKFIGITEQLPLHVRFIEFMPFLGNKWDRDKVITASTMLEKVRREYEVIKLKDEPNATAKKYKVRGYAGTFAFITTMSDHFCNTCNRMRLTADGRMKNCLFGKEEVDLLGALRNGKEIEPLIRHSVMNKHEALGGQMKHVYLSGKTEALNNRSMNKIGG
jgi:GTP 3',8-cyclase